MAASAPSISVTQRPDSHGGSAHRRQHRCRKCHRRRVFTTPGFLARDLGSPFAVLGIWVLGGILALAGALSYSELGAAYPEAGGEYVYLREAYGPLAAYLNGWICFAASFRRRLPLPRSPQGVPLGIATVLIGMPIYFYQRRKSGGL